MGTTWTHSWSSNTDPLFREWASKISAAMSTIGMVNEDRSSAASNWSAVISPYTNTANTEHAWEVWRFPNSTQQTQYPIFLRLGYGVGSSTGYPRLSITIASAKGTGGVVTPIANLGVVYTSPSFSASTGVATSWAASDGQGLVFVMNIDGGTGSSSL